MTPTLTKDELIRDLARGSGVTQRETEAVLKWLGHVIAQQAAQGVTVITPFGRFKPKTRAARTGRNPRTGEPVAIPASITVSFKASKPKS